MFAGRLTANSFKSFKKSSSSSLSSSPSSRSTSVLYALIVCAFLIVLDIDVTWSMSLDKLALERNEILDSQSESAVSGGVVGVPVLVDDMQLEAVSEEGNGEGNTDLFVLLPADHNDGIDMNTIDVGAEHGSDMLMMETNDEPAMEVVAAMPAEVVATKGEEQQAPATAEILEVPEKIIVDTPPIALLLAEQAQQQQLEQEQPANEAEKLGEAEQNKMAELVGSQQAQDEVKSASNEEPLVVGIPVDTVEDLGNTLELGFVENTESEPVVESAKLDLENNESLSNNLEEEKVEEVQHENEAALIDLPEQAQEVVTAEPIEEVPIAEPALLAEETTKQQVEDVQQLAHDSVEDVVDASEDEIKLEEYKVPSETEEAFNEEEKQENLPELANEAQEIEKLVELAEDVIEKEEQIAETSAQEEEQPKVEQTNDEAPKETEVQKQEVSNEEEQNEENQLEEDLKVAEPKDEALKEEQPKEDEQKEEHSIVEESKVEEPFAEEAKVEEPTAEEAKFEEPIAEEPKVEQPKEDEHLNALEEEQQIQEESESEQYTNGANDEEASKNEQTNSEITGESLTKDEVTDEPAKLVEQPAELNEADSTPEETVQEPQVVEDGISEENKQSLKEEYHEVQNADEKLLEQAEGNEQLTEEHNRDDPSHEEQYEQKLNNYASSHEEQNHEEPLAEQQKEETQANVESVDAGEIQEIQNEEQLSIAEQLQEQIDVEEQKAEEITNYQENLPAAIEVVAPEDDHEAMQIVEEAQKYETHNEVAETSEQKEHIANETPLQPEEHKVEINEDKNTLEIADEIKAVEGQILPVEMPAAEEVDQKETEMTVNTAEVLEPEKLQQEDEQQTVERFDKDAATAPEPEEEEHEVAVQTNEDATVTNNENDMENVHEEENQEDTLDTELNSMLTTIVQVPTQQLQLELQPSVEDEIKPAEQDENKQIEMPTAEIVDVAMQMPQADLAPEVVPQEAEEEQQQQPNQVVIEAATQKPFNVMDSVLNYVNASFMANNNQNKEQESQLQQQQDNDNAYSTQLRRYDGAQVWRIVVQNDKDKKLADELQTKYDGQLWKEVQQEVDYLLKPQVLADAARHIRAANLSRIVLIDNLQKVIEVENPPADEILQLQNRKGHRLTWKAYHRLEDIHGFFDYLAKTYPDICSVETIGYSIQKRPLKILKISNGNANNSGIWMDGGMHAREWISPASVTYIANQLVEGWDDLPDYMRNINWYIHAVANPDGYEYSHETDRLWRKNMRSHGRQCPGVDLNRNFGYKWGGKGTSASPCSQTYRGSKAFSEPETFYISKFISNYPRGTFQAYLSFHSYGQYILYPWGYDYGFTKDRTDLDRVARQAGTTITRSSGVKYTIGSSAATLYPAAGGSDDWAKGIAGIKYTYTIEMGDTGRYGFVLPASMIESNGQDAYTFVETVASAVTQPLKWSRKRAV